MNKKGLALSGGGFRASFFHLGMFAKLAENDILKDIEVISTVSGGSIVGVLYYLKLQKLLEENADETIQKSHYVALVEELIEEFFEAVQTDIRNSVLFDRFFSNTLVKIMNPFSSYTRTNKLGEIYQERMYKKYQKSMKDLIIRPYEYKEKAEQFKPREHNINRKNKVPILVINATNLNSGHNWQFQASKMGEPTNMTNMEIDKNNRFSWVHYDAKDLQKNFREYPIGQAVACSSAVPMLFTPIIVKNLYEGYKLSLSDGGIYDNQGLSGLESEGCDYIICSDASGQMATKKVSTTTLLGTNKRTIDIEMDRNRELIFQDLAKKEEKGVIKGFLFTHLKKGLEPHEVKQDNVIQEFDTTETKIFQEHIANIRTDLDIFSKTEAYALMYNGYDLFEKALEIKKIFTQDESKHDWVFLKVKNAIENDSKILKGTLEVAKYRFFRGFMKWWKSVE